MDCACRYERLLEKMPADTNSRLKSFCNEKNIYLKLNGNIKEELFGIKKLPLNRIGNSISAKKFFWEIDS